jgi:hypothetical protein
LGELFVCHVYCHEGEESSAPKQFSDYWICGDVKS